ncbi:xanthine/CO dehydrogenase XdhC/CoxF family maturation factor [Burkholderia sp. OAS925]|nr:xanthine/CO dehydrogenase XdhC/CoxF family maturation factor [Paraburkholderia graminis]
MLSTFATMALFNGFKVAVSDPRVEYMKSWSVAGVERLTYMPDDAVTAFRPDHRTCILTLSHDPKLDDLALLEALRSPAFFIGTIGSRSNSKARRERLMTYCGQTQESLVRLGEPVGIYMGSKTPAEIGVSIMAEVIAAKNDVRLWLSVARAKDQLDVSAQQMWASSSRIFVRHRAEEIVRQKITCDSFHTGTNNLTLTTFDIRLDLGQ